MAIDPQHTSSPEFRDTLVTDIEWVFDFGVQDAVTLREGDTVDTDSEPGWIVITLQPFDPGGFPEVIKHPISKIIGERHRLRVMKVRVGPVGPAATGSVTVPVGPAPADSGASIPADRVSPEGHGDSTLPAPPAPPDPPLRRKTRRPKVVPE